MAKVGNLQRLILRIKGKGDHRTWRAHYRISLKQKIYLLLDSPLLGIGLVLLGILGGVGWIFILEMAEIREIPTANPETIVFQTGPTSIYIHIGFLLLCLVGGLLCVASGVKGALDFAKESNKKEIGDRGIVSSEIKEVRG